MTARLRYLLDTNILSDLVRHPAGMVKEQIEKKGENTVCTSIIVVAELRFGANKRASSRLNQQLDAIFSVLTILPFEEPADRYYANLRSHLERQGNPIGPNDMLIAAHGLALDLTIVTANTREFSRVPELKVDNWLIV